MILSKHGENIVIDGITYTIGATVQANQTSEYYPLLGRIKEIRDGDDKETLNETVDIYCEFDEPNDDETIKMFENYFTELYGEKKTLEDIAFDEVIMAPEMIDVLEYCCECDECDGVAKYICAQCGIHVCGDCINENDLCIDCRQK